MAAYAGLRGAHGDGIGAPALVEPTMQFFPEPIRNDAASIAGVLRAMVGHSPIADDLPIELAFRLADDEDGGGCSSGACHAPGADAIARSGVEETPSGYRVVLDAPALRHLDALAASLARAVGALVLFEVNEDASAARSEVAAIVCGFGVLVANGTAVWDSSRVADCEWREAPPCRWKKPRSAWPFFSRCTAKELRKHASTSAPPSAKRLRMHATGSIRTRSSSNGYARARRRWWAPPSRWSRSAVSSATGSTGAP